MYRLLRFLVGCGGDKNQYCFAPFHDGFAHGVTSRGFASFFAWASLLLVLLVAVVATKVAIVLLLSMMDSRMVSLLVGARFWWLCRLRCRDGMMRVTLLVETGCMPGISQCHHHAE